MDKNIQTNKMIKAAIDIAIDLLSLDKISYEIDNDITTNLAYQPELNKILIKQSYIDSESPQGLLIAFSHELAHAWQERERIEGNDKYIKAFENYKQSDKCKDIEEYNSQTLEYEAHVYATIAASVIGIKPTFEKLPAELREKIYITANYLIKKYFSKHEEYDILSLI